MKLSDVSSRPDWLIWILIVALFAISVTLLSGHGSWMIAGYNTATKEEKAKYHEKRLCRTMGGGMAVITVLLFVMGMYEEKLPVEFAYVAIGIIASTFLLLWFFQVPFVKRDHKNICIIYCSSIWKADE